MATLDWSPCPAGRKIALVVLQNQQWPMVQLRLPEIVAAVHAATPGSYTEVEIPLRRADFQDWQRNNSLYSSLAKSRPSP